MAKKKIEEVIVSDKRALLENLKIDINKKLGEGTINFADEYDGSFILRRKTGVLSLDLGLRGGFPKGIIEVIGEPNIGKTALVCQTAIEVQKTYGKDACIGIIAIEKFDKKFWKDLGLRIAFSKEEIKMIEEGLERPLNEEERAYYEDQEGEIVISPPMTAEDALEACLAMVTSGMFQLLIVDSIGAVVTEVQQENNLNESTYAGISKPMGMFVNKVGLVNTDTTIIIINQLRDNMKMKNIYDDPYKESGGNALKHAKLVSLRMTKGEQIKKKIKTTDVIVGRYVNWRIKKGKGGTSEGDSGSYPFYKGKFGYALGIDKIADVVLTALDYGVIEKAGAWYSFGDERLGCGLDGAVDTLKEHPEVVQKITDAVWELDKKKNNYVFINKR